MSDEVPAREPRPGHTAVGIVQKPHGLNGELRVLAFVPEAPNLQPGRIVHIGAAKLEIETARPSRGIWLIGLEGIEDRSQADAFRGALVEVPDSEVLRLTEDTYLVYELIGLRAVTATGVDLGEITEVLQPGANDVYVVGQGRDSILIPAISEVVRCIDLTLGRVTIEPPPGLLPD